MTTQKHTSQANEFLFEAWYYELVRRPIYYNSTHIAASTDYKGISKIAFIAGLQYGQTAITNPAETSRDLVAPQGWVLVPRNLTRKMFRAIESETECDHPEWIEAAWNRALDEAPSPPL